MKFIWTILIAFNCFLANNSLIELNSEALYQVDVELNPSNLYQTSINFKDKIDAVYLYIECDNTKLAKMIDIELKQGKTNLLNVSLVECCNGVKVECESLEKIDLSLKMNENTDNQYALESTNLKIKIYDQYQRTNVKTGDQYHLFYLGLALCLSSLIIIRGIVYVMEDN